MTLNTLKKRGLSQYLTSDPVGVAICFFSLFLLTLLLRAPDVALKNMSEALSLCALRVIPSLFPFMVLSELLFGGNGLSAVAPLLRLPAGLAFGMSGESGAAVLFGVFCGAPVGAKCAATLYRGGRIDRGELTRLLTVCTPPSAPFLISAVGVSAFGSPEVGRRLFIASLVSCLLIGIVGRVFFSGSGSRGQSDVGPLTERRSLPSLITGAVTSSALTMLYVCAFVLFFSTLGGALEYLSAAIALPPAVTTLIFGFLELTAGVERASVLPNGKYLAAAISGWSGLSTALQVMSICRECDISFKPYFVSRLASALLFALVMAVGA